MLEPRARLWKLSAIELRMRAAEYRRMAETASTAQVRRSLIRLAERLERLAAQRESEA
jgi:hypothetical protein